MDLRLSEDKRVTSAREQLTTLRGSKMSGYSGREMAKDGRNVRILTVTSNSALSGNRFARC